MQAVWQGPTAQASSATGFSVASSRPSAPRTHLVYLPGADTTEPSPASTQQPQAVLGRPAPGLEVTTGWPGWPGWPGSPPASPGQYEFIVHCANQEETLGSTENSQQPKLACEGPWSPGQTGLLVDWAWPSSRQ